MNSQKKIINELRFQLGSREVKDQHYPVQLSASNANAILTMLEERNEPIKPEMIMTTGAGIGLSHCPKCGESIDEYHHPSFCGNCGQAVKWE